MYFCHGSKKACGKPVSPILFLHRSTILSLQFLSPGRPLSCDGCCAGACVGVCRSARVRPDEVAKDWTFVEAQKRFPIGSYRVSGASVRASSRVGESDMPAIVGIDRIQAFVSHTHTNRVESIRDFVTEFAIHCVCAALLI